MIRAVSAAVTCRFYAADIDTRQSRHDGAATCPSPPPRTLPPTTRSASYIFTDYHDFTTTFPERHGCARAARRQMRGWSSDAASRHTDARREMEQAERWQAAVEVRQAITGEQVVIMSPRHLRRRPPLHPPCSITISRRFSTHEVHHVYLRAMAPR